MQAAMAARPVFSCSMVAACTFIMLLLIIVLVAADALDTPYYLNHLISTQKFWASKQMAAAVVPP